MGHALSQRVRGNEGWVLLALADFSGDTAPPYTAHPSVQTIGEWAKASESTVHRSLNKLMADGHIERVGRSDVNTWVYRLAAVEQEGHRGTPPVKMTPESLHTSSKVGSSHLGAVLTPPLSNWHPETEGGGDLAIVAERLEALAAELRIAPPGRASLATIISEFPKLDHDELSRDLDFWVRHGTNGQRTFRNLASLYRNFCRRAKPPTEREEKRKRDETYDRIVAETGFSMLPNTPREEG
jgi:hypothetical protein